MNFRKHLADAVRAARNEKRYHEQTTRLFEQDDWSCGHADGFLDGSLEGLRLLVEQVRGRKRHVNFGARVFALKWRG